MTVNRDRVYDFISLAFFRVGPRSFIDIPVASLSRRESLEITPITLIMQKITIINPTGVFLRRWTVLTDIFPE